MRWSSGRCPGCHHHHLRVCVHQTTGLMPGQISVRERGEEHSPPGMWNYIIWEKRKRAPAPRKHVKLPSQREVQPKEKPGIRVIRNGQKIQRFGVKGSKKWRVINSFRTPLGKSSEWRQSLKWSLWGSSLSYAGPVKTLLNSSTLDSDLSSMVCSQGKLRSK